MRNVNFEQAVHLTMRHAGRICGAATTGHVTAAGLGMVAPASFVAVVTAPLAGTLLVNIAAEVYHAAVDRPSLGRRCAAFLMARPGDPFRALADDVVRNATQYVPFPNTNSGQRWTEAYLMVMAKNAAIHAAALCVAGATVGCLGLSLPLSPLVLCVDMLLGSAVLVCGHIAYQAFRDAHAP